MKKINRKRFDVYVDFTRNPSIFLFGKEVGWYENDAHNIIGVIIWDFHDKDFNAMLLGRDENRKFRGYHGKSSLQSFDEAEEWIFETSAKYESENYEVFSQGYDLQPGIDLFAPVVVKSKLNPLFEILSTSPTHSAAKALIAEITPHFFDIDGNFVEQFQTQGFDSRLWELYLFCYFNEEHLQINRSYNAPDFLLSNGKTEISLEAVIVGRKTPPSPYSNIEQLINVDVEKEIDNSMPILFGSPLYSKLNHTARVTGQHYWEFPHTLGKPFVIAIADFHEDFAMTWSTTALVEYLYGYRYSSTYDEKGNLIIHPEKINSHKNPETGKVIPSGFFFQPGTENISAILHTSSGTISKFNRKGKQCGFDENNTEMLRCLLYYNFEENASNPIPLQYSVSEETDEAWSEGISIYHNPNAAVPLSNSFFPSAAQHSLKGENIVSDMRGPFVLTSYTMLIVPKRNS